MSKNRIICISLLAFVIFFFLWGIPLGVYVHYTYFLAFTGGFLVFVLLGQALGEFEAIYEPFEKQDPSIPETLGRKMAPFAMIPALVMVFFFVISASNKADKVLREEGVSTKAKIFDGSATSTTRRFKTNTTYEVLYTYKDSLDRPYTSSGSVTFSEFSSVYKNMEIDVVYWKKDPRVSKVLFGPEDMATYKKVPNREIAHSDILNILEGKISKDSMLHYLNAINYEWVVQEKIYVNNHLDLAIKIIDPYQVAYVENFQPDVMLDGGITSSLEKDGFSKMGKSEKGKEVVMYVKDPYTVVVERKLSHANGATGMRMLHIYYFIKKSN